MDLLTRADIRTLTADAGEGPHVCLFMPTHRFGIEVAGDRLRWKSLVRAAEAALRGDLRRPDVETLLAPAWELERDGLAWQYMSDGLAMFLSPDAQHTFRVPVRLPELVTIGDHRVVGPLLPMYGEEENFWLLAVSQRDVRLMEGTRHTVEQVDLGQMPTSLRDVVDPPDSRTDTMARPASLAGRGGPAIFYGHGAARENLTQEDVHRFLRQVADGLGQVLAGERAPMVLVGLDALVGAFRTVNGYPHVLDDAVLRNPDDLTAEQLHTLARPIVDERIRAELAEVVDQFHALNGTGRASANPDLVSTAAEQGRVQTLFVTARPSCWDKLATEESDVVRLGVGGPAAACERVDDIVVDTLAAGGQVYMTSGPLAPGEDVAAIFRY
ncbi:MAG: hypothetical protein ABI746_00895 [Dermatophilaceae bacterium]